MKLPHFPHRFVALAAAQACAAAKNGLVTQCLVK